MDNRSVNARQLEVLRWIADGCPDGVMADSTYKTTALALQGRRLATVTRKRGAWSAEPTKAGLHYLEHGCYPPDHWAHTEPPARPRRHQRPAAWR